MRSHPVSNEFIDMVNMIECVLFVERGEVFMRAVISKINESRTWPSKHVLTEIVAP